VASLLHHWSNVYLLVAAALFLCTQALQMGTSAARLAGVRAGRVATGLTLFNLFATSSRLINLFYGLLLSSLTDHARVARDAAGFDSDMRLIMLAATVGTIAGGAMIPWIARIMHRGIAAFERTGSLPGALARMASPSVLAWMWSEFRLPTAASLRYSAKALPKSALLWNTVVMAFWVAGPLAALYASVLAPGVTATCIAASGLITGVATVTLTLIVDPAAALITDQAASGSRPEADLKAMLLYLVATAIAGTLLAQLLLYPAANVIALVARFLYDHGFETI
jgi:Alternate to MurJ